MDIDFKRIALAMLLSVSVVVAWEYFFPSNTYQQNTLQQESTPTISESVENSGNNVALTTKSYEEIISNSKRIVIENKNVAGSINLTGAVIDDLSLTNYKQELNSNESVRLLSPEGTEKPYYIQSGWSSKAINTPDKNTVWQSDAKSLTKDSPVTLRWSNSQGVTFVKTFYLDDKYMVRVRDEIINQTGKQIEVYNWSAVRRVEEPKSRVGAVFHEGPLFISSGELKDFSYKDIKKETRENYIKDGWFGFSDKYWLVAVSPKEGDFKTRFLNTKNFASQGNAVERVQADHISKPIFVESGAKVNAENRFFIGPKESRTLKAYEKEYGIEKLDSAIDFGMFFFITKPLLKMLLFLNDKIHNFGIAIILLTIFVRLALFPLSLKSHKSMVGLKSLQPRMKELKEKYSANPQKYNKILMEEYKKEGVNPLSGCLPILVQIPIFFAIYKVIFMSIEMRHAPFFGYLKDLSVLDPTSLFNLFGLLPYSVPSFLTIGLLPLLMGLTMFLQQKISMNSITDPVQKRVFMMLPFVFTFLLASFPSGLVLYWVSSNTISITQQLIFNKFFSPKKKH